MVPGNAERTGTMADETGTREPRGLERRIDEQYESLPPSERPLADLMLEYPGDLLFYSATALAQRSQVSKAAVTRLVKRLGYTDYRELQREVRAAQEAGEPIYLNTSLVQPAHMGDSVEMHLEREVMLLRQTFEGLRPRDLDEVAARALSARHVWVAGFRNSYFFASYVRRQIIQVRPQVTLLPQPGQLPAEDLAHASSEDLAIVIGLRRRPPQLRTLMTQLVELGVPLAYVTDRGAVSTRRLATWCLPCQTRGMSLFDSYVGVISVLNYLCTEIAALAGETGRERLRRIEDLMDEGGEIDSTS